MVCCDAAQAVDEIQSQIEGQALRLAADEVRLLPIHPTVCFHIIGNLETMHD